MDNLVQLKPESAGRVLVVEDEVLVGMMMRDLLGDMGFFVSGPFCSLAEANAAVDAQGFDVAVLDVNLAGEFVYPLADRLRALDVPCVFVTGYDQQALDARFAHFPVLQKPIHRQNLEPVLRACIKTKVPANDGDAAPPAKWDGKSDAATA